MIKDFRFNKALGQNFIFDENLLRAIISDSDINENDTVLEIGTGAATLTKEIAKKAKRVISLEVDKRLSPIIEKNLADFNNVEVHFLDILSIKQEDLQKMLNLGEFKVLANLPYYITTPLIFYFLESELNVSSITVMVQREVAQKIISRVNSPDYGVLTLNVRSRCTAKILRNIGRNVFTPPPNVDSALINLKLVNEYDKNLSNLIKNLFSMRRKTILNNLLKHYDIGKERLEGILEGCNINLNARAQELELDRIKELKERIYKE